MPRPRCSRARSAVAAPNLPRVSTNLGQPPRAHIRGRGAAPPASATEQIDCGHDPLGPAQYGGRENSDAGSVALGAHVDGSVNRKSLGTCTDGSGRGDSVGHTLHASTGGDGAGGVTCAAHARVSRGPVSEAHLTPTAARTCPKYTGIVVVVSTAHTFGCRPVISHWSATPLQAGVESGPVPVNVPFASRIHVGVTMPHPFAAVQHAQQYDRSGQMRYRMPPVTMCVHGESSLRTLLQ